MILKYKFYYIRVKLLRINKKERSFERVERNSMRKILEENCD